MLGDTFGLNAGLTRVELTLFRFLAPRPPFDSGFDIPVGPEGDATALELGLVLEEGLGLTFDLGSFLP